jgi:hypothetical protein
MDAMRATRWCTVSASMGSSMSGGAARHAANCGGRGARGRRAVGTGGRRGSGPRRSRPARPVAAAAAVARRGRPPPARLGAASAPRRGPHLLLVLAQARRALERLQRRRAEGRAERLGLAREQVVARDVQRRRQRHVLADGGLHLVHRLHGCQRDLGCLCGVGGRRGCRQAAARARRAGSVARSTRAAAPHGHQGMGSSRRTAAAPRARWPLSSPGCAAGRGRARAARRAARAPAQRRRARPVGRRARARPPSAPTACRAPSAAAWPRWSPSAAAAAAAARPGSVGSGSGSGTRGFA